MPKLTVTSLMEDAAKVLATSVLQDDLGTIIIRVDAGDKRAAVVVLSGEEALSRFDDILGKVVPE
jgi:hypothetical protein